MTAGDGKGGAVGEQEGGAAGEQEGRAAGKQEGGQQASKRAGGGQAIEIVGWRASERAVLEGGNNDNGMVDSGGQGGECVLLFPAGERTGRWTNERANPDGERRLR